MAVDMAVISVWMDARWSEEDPKMNTWVWSLAVSTDRAAAIAQHVCEGGGVRAAQGSTAGAQLEHRLWW